MNESVGRSAAVKRADRIMNQLSVRMAEKLTKFRGGGGSSVQFEWSHDGRHVSVWLSRDIAQYTEYQQGKCVRDINFGENDGALIQELYAALDHLWGPK